MLCFRSVLRGCSKGLGWGWGLICDLTEEGPGSNPHGCVSTTQDTVGCGRGGFRFLLAVDLKAALDLCHVSLLRASEGGRLLVRLPWLDLMSNRYIYSVTFAVFSGLETSHRFCPHLRGLHRT